MVVRDHLKEWICVVSQILQVLQAKIWVVVEVEDVLDEALCNVLKDKAVHVVHVLVAEHNQQDPDRLTDVDTIIVARRHLIVASTCSELLILLVKMACQDAFVAFDAAFNGFVSLEYSRVKMTEAPIEELFMASLVTHR